MVDAYLDVGRSLESGHRVTHSEGVVQAAEDLVQIIDHEIDSIRFETAEADAVIMSRSGESLTELEETRRRSTDIAKGHDQRTYGAVTGRVQTLSSRNGLRFSLYDLLNDKAVSCYLAVGAEDQMREVWGRVAVVEGRIRRDPATGRPMTVRGIGSVQVLPEKELRPYTNARGAAMRFGSRLSPEAAIRRVRDA